MLDLPPLTDRREFMKLMSAELALAASGWIQLLLTDYLTRNPVPS